GRAGVLPGPERSAGVLLRERQAAPGDGRERKAAVLVPALRGERAVGCDGGGGAGGRGRWDRARGGGVERSAGDGGGRAAAASADGARGEADGSGGVQVGQVRAGV